MSCICVICKKEIPDNRPRYHGRNPMCINCGDEEITVYYSWPDDCNKITYDSIDEVVTLIKESDKDDVIHITKAKMTRIQYLTLPEADGY